MVVGLTESFYGAVLAPLTTVLAMLLESFAFTTEEVPLENAHVTALSQPIKSNEKALWSTRELAAAAICIMLELYIVFS